MDNQHTNNSSSALEFVPPINQNGTYNISNDDPYGPDTWEWLYQDNFFSDVQSGAFRLPNGNTIITEADDAYVIEVNSEGDVVWFYDYPVNSAMIARCTKYDLSNLGGNFVILGDVNFDNIINVLDVIQTVNFILGYTIPTEEQSIAADLNEDGSVNVTDILLIVNIILTN